MKVKTSDLQGAALDWAVAKCEGKEVKAWAVHRRLGRCDYSTNWAQGGPIIEREGIALIPGWTAERPGFSADGPTPLIAAMRCYVASCLGDEVEIPEELK
jgi:Protein of unknown function (DUF2591)